MINSRAELYDYLKADKKALGRKRRKPLLTDLIWRYQIALRYCEYYSNLPGGGLKRLYYRWRKHQLGIKCGFTIPNNVVGKGLCLAHIGPIIISPYAYLGEWCRIHVGVNIGADARDGNKAPSIGNRVYIAPGAKLFGDIVIADDIAIGANAVVTKSFHDKGCSIAGIPAKKISDKGSAGIITINE